jgi:hypothetical protein
MRLLAALAILLAIPFVAIVAVTNIARPAAAADRLRGVGVVVTSQSTEDLGAKLHRLRLTVDVTSATDIQECLGFAVDEPFAGRRLQREGGGCVKPRSGLETVRLVFDRLTDDDLVFPSHTLVWGIPGGRCGPILELFGVCVVDQAGTADFELPSKNPLPSFAPFGSFAPLSSFGPYFSFEP